jgi:hypothetical protein
MIKKTQSTYIDGPVGRIETRIGRKPRQERATGLVVLSHPHPQFGGSMDNKVLTTLEKAFADNGWQTLAFNFRGVGGSDGAYDGGVGEQADLVAVVEWATMIWGAQPLALAGFSFGSYISLKQAQRLGVARLVTVAPPVNLYDFRGISVDEGLDWLLIQGGQDEVVDPQAVMDWARKQPHAPDILWRERASHYFHGELIWLRRVVSALMPS